MERIFAAMGDGIVLLDEHSSILYENAAAQQMRALLVGTPGEKQAIEAKAAEVAGPGKVINQLEVKSK